MTKLARAGLQFAEVDLHHPEKKSASLLELAVGKKDVLVAKSVVEEVRRRVMHFRGESKHVTDKEKEKQEKEAELKVEEKTRAAAWAWYEHGNGGAPPHGSSAALIHPRGIFGNVRRASRFKTEALKVGNNSGKVEPRWDFETSLFDGYELASVSKQIDHAFHESCNTPPPRYLQSPPPRLSRNPSVRVSRSLCRSISDVVSPDELALGVRKCDCSKEKSRRSGAWSFRRISKALQVLMHVPGCDLHEHSEPRTHLHEHHHHHHQHEHHHHYSIKMKDGSQYGKHFSSAERVKSSPFPSFPKAR